MNDREKLELLRKQDTKTLIPKIALYEDKLEEALREEASLKNLNYGYLASGTNDCQEVKRILAELSAKIPEQENGKKLTAADKEAWLIRQRKENDELCASINRQKNVAFQIESAQINAEMAKKRLEGIKAVLAIKTSQFNFLAS